MADTTVHFHSGSNLAGYLPEGDVTCTDTWEEARVALVHTLDRDADAIAEQCNHPGIETLADCESCTTLADAERVATRLDTEDCSAGFLDYVADGSRTLAYWIELVPASDCEVESD